MTKLRKRKKEQKENNNVFGLAVRHVRSSGQILLPRYLMNGLSNLDNTHRK